MKKKDILIPGLLAFSCTQGPVQEYITTGPLVDEDARLQFAVYFLPTPSADPIVVLATAVAELDPSLHVVNTSAERPETAQMARRMRMDVAENYAPPEEGLIVRSGFGVSAEQALAVQQCREALVMDFAYPRRQIWTAVRKANEIAEATARATDGLIWDEETRQLFAPDAWREQRLDSWHDSIPDVSRHITIHAYKRDTYVRAVTLGMAKFGLPDMVIDRFSWSMQGQMGNLINLCCQTFAEGAQLEHRGEFRLDLHTVHNSSVRKAHVESLSGHAMGAVDLVLRTGIWEEGDPRNRLIEICFDKFPGVDLQTRQDALLCALFGCEEDSVARIAHTNELLEASEDAKLRLPALREAFRIGLGPGEYILVKAPFSTPDGGNEWMWVEVTLWKGNRIKGILRNEPENVPGVRAGSTVEVNELDVFDYIRYLPDGTQEGNWTAAILQQQMGSD